MSIRCIDCNDEIIDAKYKCTSTDYRIVRFDNDNLLRHISDHNLTNTD